MTIRMTSMRSRAGRATVVAGLAASLLLVATDPSGAATKAPASGLSPSTLGALQQDVVVLTGKDFANAAGTSQVLSVVSHGVSFATGTCAADAAAGQSAGQIDATNVAVASPTRLVIGVPGGGGGLADAVANGVEAKKDYNLCVYSSIPTSGAYKLRATAKLTVYPKPTLDPVAFLSSTSGPASGGQAITVIGDTSAGTPAAASGYFTGKTTATLAGVPLVGIKVAKDGNSFTAVTPPMPAGPADLVVTTEGGSVTAAAAYTVTNAIIVSPSLVNPTGGSVVSVKGKGFRAIKDAPGFGVVFYAGTYDSFGNPGTPCDNVLVVSDTDLVCDSPVLNPGAYNVMVTDDMTGAGPTYSSVISGAATVTASGF
jgi:hypothetical protein